MHRLPPVASMRRLPPVMQNQHFSMAMASPPPKESFCTMIFIKAGFVILSIPTYASVWVRTADYQQFTKCSAYPHGISPECKGFHSYKEAIAYVCWDPATSFPPVQKIILNRPSTICGWLLLRALVLTRTNGAGRTSWQWKSRLKLLQNLIRTTTWRISLINKAFKDNTDAVLKAFGSQ